MSFYPSYWRGLWKQVLTIWRRLRLLPPKMEFFVSKKPPGFEGSTKGFDTMPGF